MNVGRRQGLKHVLGRQVVKQKSRIAHVEIFLVETVLAAVSIGGCGTRVVDE